MLRLAVLLTFICAAVFDSTLAASCTNPKATVNSFSTQDATILSELGHIGEITLTCDNGAQPSLFAEFPCGKVVPVALVSKNKYQVSWTEDIKAGSSGNVVVRLFDEDGYANLRKAQRDGERAANVKSLIDVNIATRGAYKGPWIKAELLAAFIVGGIAYFALTNKGKVQS